MFPSSCCFLVSLQGISSAGGREILGLSVVIRAREVGFVLRAYLLRTGLVSSSFFILTSKGPLQQ